MGILRITNKTTSLVLHLINTRGWIIQVGLKSGFINECDGQRIISWRNLLASC